MFLSFRFLRLLAVLAASSFPVLAPACDLCAVYAASQAEGQASTGLYLGVAEQFTRIDRLSDDGHRIDHDGGQHLNSSVTQFLLGYGLTDRVSLQASLPYIRRSFSRPTPEGTEHGTEHGTVSGLGDISLIAQYTAWRRDTETSTASLRLLGGIKLPTGDSDRVAEELDEEEEEEGEEGVTPSGIHGHDLALGTGSTDALLGVAGFARSGRWLARGEVQYTRRTRGDFDYRFGDDVQWSVGAGRYLLLTDDHTLSAMLHVSGESKDFDDLDGETKDDNKSRIVTVGPQLQYSHGARYSVDLRADLPVENYGSEVQTLPGYRLRLAVLTRF